MDSTQRAVTPHQRAVTPHQSVVKQHQNIGKPPPLIPVWREWELVDGRLKRPYVMRDPQYVDGWLLVSITTDWKVASGCLLLVAIK
jgi:hypothetical protein